MRLNLYAPQFQNDLRNAAQFIDNNTNLSAKLNNHNQIELKTDKGLTVKRLNGSDVIKKMNRNTISTYV
ncbi:hypothetical protein [Vibrio sp. THAF190c]|uniref:hypothetical protein n=1 Tax=Vibrio sp. THAF190c TaxID=2587865 RepID=UPI0012680F18|nr:hypothetical protein [Vibrio sp. THAF190c]QFT13539.1 hypothetical protein FIV04_26650 [Vibrio sp. THAF190c]